MTPRKGLEPTGLPEPASSIRRVRIRNYKSIRKADVLLSPLTILVGRNGSGKSNFLDAIRFVAESLQVSLEYAVKTRGGLETVRRRTKRRSTTLSVDLQISLPSRRIVDYGFALLPRRRGFIVQRESLLIRSSDQEVVDYYEIEKGNVKKASFESPPTSSDERLYLVSTSGLPSFREVYDALTLIGFYNLNPEVMRGAQSPDSGEILRRDGSNIASVVRRLRKEQPRAMGRVQSYLAAIAPDITDVRVLSLGPHETLVFEQRLADSPVPSKFFAESMSDGTLRAIGILVAAAQLSELRMPLTVVGFEEPETALHPAATRALMDALREAAAQTQILVTSHSPDLLDNIDLERESLLAVVSQEGSTRIAPLDEASRRAIKDHLYTPGELLRLDQLEPDPKDLARQEQMALFEGEEDDEPAADRADRRRAR